MIVLVADSVGVGALPDADLYRDQGSNTLANVALVAGGLKVPTLVGLGLGNIVPALGVSPVASPDAAHGRMMEASVGKDSTTGHWELMGLILKEPFPLYPCGFPSDLISSFEQRIGRKVLGNRPASGTEIIAELGIEHLNTGHPIVYTSGDSVFQIAAHEEVVSLKELYDICLQARFLLTGAHAVARVIARPFIGTTGNFHRTQNRRDFSLPPPSATVLDLVHETGYRVLGIGKIGDIFAGRGLSDVWPSKSNRAGIKLTKSAMIDGQWDLIFTNLVDFDALYGHRNDPEGYASCIEEFDGLLADILKQLQREDVLIITADHGCDPTMPGTDHSREYVPLLVYGARIKPQCLGTRNTFADVGATIAEILTVSWDGAGTSFWDAITNNN